jgi:hypothetical protein
MKKIISWGWRHVRLEIDAPYNNNAGKSWTYTHYFEMWRKYE